MRTAVFVATCALVLAPRAGAAEAPLKFGFDANSTKLAQSLGMPVSYSSLWAGAWNQKEKYGWGGLKDQLQTAKASGVVPLIQWSYWGDDISPDCVEHGCNDRYEGVHKAKATWYRLSNELADLIVQVMGPHSDALVVIEPGFNKGGIQDDAAFDGYLVDHTQIFHNRNVKVILGFGNSDQSKWNKFGRAVAEVDLIGVMLFQSSVHDPKTYLSGADMLLSAAQYNQETFGKPTFVTNFAFSSYPEPSYELYQDAVVRDIFRRIDEFRDAGVAAMVWRALADDPKSDATHDHGEAERHWGLIHADGSPKPALTPFLNGMLDATESSAPDPQTAPPQPAPSQTAPPQTAPPQTAPASLQTVTGSGSISIYPGQSIQEVVNAYPAGTSFLIKQGMHRRQTIRPKDGMSFIGEAGAVLDGENVTPRAFIGEGTSNVTVRGLRITGYQPPNAGAALDGIDSDGWIVESNEIDNNSNGAARAYGLRIGNRGVVRGNKIHHNGWVGISGYKAVETLIEGNEIYANPPGSFKDTIGEAANIKLFECGRIVIRDNYVHDSPFRGIWLDTSQPDMTIEGNRIVNHGEPGIWYEVSYRGVIRNNYVENAGYNSYYSSGWMRGGGIQVTNSPDVSVVGNTVVNSLNGIIGQQANDYKDGPYGPNQLRNLLVQGNTIVMPKGQTGIAQNMGTSDVFQAWNNRFVDNRYELPNNPTPFHWMDRDIDEARWRAYGQDVQQQDVQQSSCTTAPPPPSGLTSSVSGSTVTLRWNSGAGTTASYVVEAGSSSGLADLANFDTGSAASLLTVNGVAGGHYFVRVRGRSSCGTSGPSNEILVTVP